MLDKTELLNRIDQAIEHALKYHDKHYVLGLRMARTIINQMEEKNEGQNDLPHT